MAITISLLTNLIYRVSGMRDIHCLYASMRHSRKYRWAKMSIWTIHSELLIGVSLLFEHFQNNHRFHLSGSRRQIQFDQVYLTNDTQIHRSDRTVRSQSEIATTSLAHICYINPDRPLSNRTSQLQESFPAGVTTTRSAIPAIDHPSSHPSPVSATEKLTKPRLLSRAFIRLRLIPSI